MRLILLVDTAVVLAVTAVLISALGLAAPVWAQGELAATEDPAIAGAPPTPQEVEEARKEPSEDEKAEVEGAFHIVHLIGKVGVLGLFLALVTGLCILLTRPEARWRPSLRRIHFLLGGLFGLVAMTHGTLFFLGHIEEGAYKEIVNSGSWLCTSVFFLILTGLMRAYTRARPIFWRLAHRVFQVAFVVAVLAHVLPKVT